MSEPLAGVRVVDATTGVAGGYAGKLLADAGADVVRIPPQGRDPLAGRRLGEHLHAGKRSASPPDDAAVVLLGADDSHSGAHAPGFESRFDAAVRVHLSPFGLNGPWAGRPATEFTIQAWCGSLEMRELGGRPPVAAGGTPALWAAGAVAALGAVAYLGRSTSLDVSILEVASALWGTNALEAELLPGGAPPPRAPEVPSVEPAADGLVGFGIVTAQQWSDFCRLVEKPEWVEDERLATMAGRHRHLEEVVSGIEGWMQRHTVAELVEQAALFRIPVVPIGNGATVEGIPCYAEGETYRVNAKGSFREPRSALRFGAAHPRADGKADASLGSGALPGSPSSPHASEPPLAGLRVADFTAFWAGPYATQLLAGLGADVIHVESTAHPDGMRLRSVKDPASDHWWEWSPIFHAVNAGKRSVTLDLDAPAGLALAQDLIRCSDVVVENFSPRVMERWGLTGDGIAALHPSAVSVRMPAFGLDGPWRDRTGFQMTMEQMSGIAWRTGWPDERPLCPYVCDATAGIHAAFAAVCGLYARRRDGRGRCVEVRMCEVAAALAAEQVIEWSAEGRLLTRRGNDGADGANQAVHRCADGSWLAVAAETRAQREALAAVVGEGEGGLAAWCAERSSDRALAAIWDAGVPAALVTSGRDACENPQHRARGFHQRQLHPVTGAERVPSLPLREAFAPALPLCSAAPTLGQHNREVLGDLLGVDADALADLLARGVAGDRIDGSRAL